MRKCYEKEGLHEKTEYIIAHLSIPSRLSPKYQLMLLYASNKDVVNAELVDKNILAFIDESYFDGRI